MTDRKPSPSEWARQQRTRGNVAKHCIACDEPIRGVIREILEEIIARRSDASWEAIRKFLAEHYGYGLHTQSVTRHLQNHEPKLYAESEKARHEPLRDPESA